MRWYSKSRPVLRDAGTGHLPRGDSDIGETLEIFSSYRDIMEVSWKLRGTFIRHHLPRMAIYPFPRISEIIRNQLNPKYRTPSVTSVDVSKNCDTSSSMNWCILHYMLRPLLPDPRSGLYTSRYWLFN